MVGKENAPVERRVGHTRTHLLIEHFHACEIYGLGSSLHTLRLRVECHHSINCAEVEKSIACTQGRAIVELVGWQSVFFGENLHRTRIGAEFHKSFVGAKPQVSVLVL